MVMDRKSLMEGKEPQNFTLPAGSLFEKAHQQDATDVLTYLVYNRLIYLTTQGGNYLDPDQMFDASGKVKFPLIGKNVWISTEGDISGVVFKQVDAEWPKKWPPGPMQIKAQTSPFCKPAKKQPTHEGGGKGLNQAFVIFLYRFAEYLSDALGVTEIYYGGLNGGGGDSHKQGRAIDYYGSLAKDKPFFVFWDWGVKPLHPQAVKAKDSIANLWSNEKSPVPKYRLEGGLDLEACKFFNKVMEFAKTQKAWFCDPDCSTGKCDAKKRDAHQTHIHTQLGGA